MRMPDEHISLTTKCYIHGSLRTLPLIEAYVLFWEVPFAWLEPINWIRHGKLDSYVKDLMKPAIKYFAYNLLTRGYMPLTINSVCMLDEHGYAPSRNNFQSKAFRLKKIFGERLPFTHDHVFDDKKKFISSYQMLPGSKWAIVVGIAPDSEIRTSEIDWTIFQIPPDNKEKKAIMKILKGKNYL